MGLLAKLKRDYRNAGALVSVSFNIVANLDHRENIKEPWFFCQSTGLELHNFANGARKDFLGILNSDPDKYRSRIKIPEDYWRLAIHATVPIFTAHAKAIPDQLFATVRDASCLLVECAFDAFEADDALSVYLLSTGEVSVELFRKHSLDLDQVRLGNINERT